MPRFAVVSDIHGNILALEAVAADIEARKIRSVIVLGDHLSGPLWAKETARYLMSRDWLLIAGNHDRTMARATSRDLGVSDRQALEDVAAEERNWLAALPPTATLAHDVLAVHGTPFDDSVYLLETVEQGRTRLASPAEIRQRLGDASVGLLLCGHSHVPRVVGLDTGPVIVNPGSVGLPAYDDDGPEPHVVETGSPDARYGVLDERDGAWVVELISVPYDHHRAARRARAKDRPDWEIALRTGRMTD